MRQIIFPSFWGWCRACVFQQAALSQVTNGFENSMHVISQMRGNMTKHAGNIAGKWEMGMGQTWPTPKTHEIQWLTLGFAIKNQHKVTMMRIWINCLLHSLPVNPDLEANQEGIGFIHITWKSWSVELCHPSWYATNNTWFYWLTTHCSAEGELDAERTARLQILHQLLLGAGCSGEYVPYAMDQNQTP